MESLDFLLRRDPLELRLFLEDLEPLEDFSGSLAGSMTVTTLATGTPSSPVAGVSDILTFVKPFDEAMIVRRNMIALAVSSLALLTLGALAMDGEESSMLELEVKEILWGQEGALGLDLDGDVKCPDKSSCGDSETCCEVQTAGYGCCKYAEAECCIDKRHCCPNGMTVRNRETIWRGGGLCLCFVLEVFELTSSRGYCFRFLPC